MNVFEKYSIEEINKKTKISPISLRYIKNKEFSKLPRVKFIGFIRIIEKEFRVDLSDLIKEYEEATKHIDEEVKFESPKKNSNFLIMLFAISLIVIGGHYLYKTTNQNKNILLEQNYSITQEINNTISKIEKNQTTNEENNTTLKDTNTTQINNATIQIKSIQIIPKERVWFRAINLDNNKTVEYLTSSPKELNGSNWYIKFGHGYIIIRYGNEIIVPSITTVLRVLFKDGKYEFLKKPNRHKK